MSFQKYWMMQLNFLYAVTHNRVCLLLRTRLNGNFKGERRPPHGTSARKKALFLMCELKDNYRWNLSELVIFWNLGFSGLQTQAQLHRSHKLLFFHWQINLWSFFFFFVFSFAFECDVLPFINCVCERERVKEEEEEISTQSDKPEEQQWAGKDLQP